MHPQTQHHCNCETGALHSEPISLVSRLSSLSTHYHPGDGTTSLCRPHGGQTSPADFTGLDWWTHGRLVNYDQPNPAEPLISNWLIQNPQRINLARIGFHLPSNLNISSSSSSLTNASQTLDLYTGTITSTFTVVGSEVQVRTSVDPDSDTIAVQVKSDLIEEGKLGIFFDYPYPDVNKFDAPFVGVWNQTEKHTTSLQQTGQQAQIRHDIDATTYFTTVQWGGEAAMSGPLNGTHRYVLLPKNNESGKVNLTVNFSPSPRQQVPDAHSIASSSTKWWETYWDTGAFIDLTQTKNSNATELHRRTILSQHLLVVNSAGHDPPQESGLANNGWYGKFHVEMVVWHFGPLGSLEQMVPSIPFNSWNL